MSGPKLRDVTNESAPAPRARRRRIDPPAWLSKSGKAAFRRLLLDIERSTPEAIGAVDVPALALTAEVYAVAQAAAKAMRGPGNEPQVLDVDAAHGGGNRKTPAWQVLNQATTRYQGLAREYGLTLAARTRLELGTAAPLDDEDDEDLEDAL